MYPLTPHQADALNTQYSISLTANAGSGKTYVLASRYLKIILESDTSIHEIAAITFTEKAAGELYKRIAEELSSLSQQNNSTNLTKKISKLRKQLVSAKISTIHSFCVDLLREFPVEASLDANFIPIDQRKSEDLTDLCIEKVIRNRFTDKENNKDLKLLIRLLGSKKVLVRELAKSVQNRKRLYQVKDLFIGKTIEEIENFYSERFNNGLEELLKLELPVVIPHFTKINEKVLANNNQNNLANKVKGLLKNTGSAKNKLDALRILAILNEESFTKKGSLKIRGYLSAELRRELKLSTDIVETFFREFKGLFSIESVNGIEIELAKYSRAMLIISFLVIEEYEIQKKQMDYLDFEDILLKTKEILEIENVRTAVNGKYKYLLVDEYQDTNEIQYEIFLPVVNYLKTGNLFVVGDEKQSIYRFRDAELEVFGRTRRDIKYADNSNLVLTLPDSYRMAPGICLFSNHIFNKLFANPKRLYNEVDHSDLVCARDDSIKGKVEFLISEDDDRFAEAELIAKRIIKLKSESVKEVSRWNDIAVLVRKRTAFSDLEKAFVKYRIPFTVIGGTGFYQQQSISDIYNYLTFLFNNSDDAAFIGILRSPFFSVSDTKIFQLSIYGGDTYWEKLVKAANDNDYWKSLYSIIDENLRLAKRVNIPSLLQKILNESNFIPIIASRINGEQELNNIEKLVSLTIKFFSQEFNSLYDYLVFLKNSISNFVEESQAAIEDKGNCVNVMTIHQAKGLQYSAVFLYRCNDSSHAENIKARSFEIDKNLGLLTKVPIDNNYFGKYYSAPIVELYNFIEKKKSKAELTRLLYVGITRAKNFLFISAEDIPKKTISSNSFIGLLLYALKMNLKQSSIRVAGTLNYLVKSNNKFRVVNRKIDIKIPLVRDVELREIDLEDTNIRSYAAYLIDVKNDHSKGEVISATKFSVFMACPRKYNLIYNIKLNFLAGDYNKWLKASKKDENYEYFSNEQRRIIFDDSSSQTLSPSNMRGNVIHKILQRQNRIEDFESIISNDLELGKHTQANRHLKEEITKTINRFFKSDEYQFLKSFTEYRNEFEVFCKLEDFYLFGIIDKVLFADKKIIIVDYKTDIIPQSEIIKKGEEYSTQLNFYALILKRLYPSYTTIETRIIFLRYPDEPYIKKFTKSDEKEIISEIKEMIISIRNNNYSVNLNHCSDCIFYVSDKTCILA